MLEAAAVLGKEFPARLLARVADLDETAFEDRLRELVAAEFLYERTPGRDPSYSFRHPQTQDVAYRSQLRDRRGRLHAAAARASAEHYPDQLDERSALIAHHWERAGEDLEAARWFARAAAWSGNSNPAESVRSWRRVIELTDGLPESDESIGLGLVARVATIHWGWRLGLSSDDAERIFEQAEAMAIKSGDQALRLLLLGGYGAVLGLGQGRIDEYARLARDALALAEEADDPSLCMPPNAYAFFLTGDLREGLTALDRAIDAAGGDPTFGAGIVFTCPYALCLSHKGSFLTMLGELDAAREAIEEGRAMAREHGDPEALWNVIGGASRLEYVAGDAAAALEHARSSVELAERHGDALSRAWSWTHLGVAELMRGEWTAAIEALERADEISRERTNRGRGPSGAHGPPRRSSPGRRRPRQGIADLGAGFLERAPTRAAPSRSSLPDWRWRACCSPRQARCMSTGSRRSSAPSSKWCSGSAPARTSLRSGSNWLSSPASGDEERRERELTEARRLFTEIGATARAAETRRRRGRRRGVPQ